MGALQSYLTAAAIATTTSPSTMLTSTKDHHHHHHHHHISSTHTHTEKCHPDCCLALSHQQQLHLQLALAEQKQQQQQQQQMLSNSAPMQLTSTANATMADSAMTTTIASDLLPPQPTTKELYCAMMAVLIQQRYKAALEYCHPATSQPCYKIYRNWHPDDHQRQEKHLEHVQGRFLMSYPAEKYKLIRPEDHSPVVNEYYNLSGLFFCATAAPVQQDEQGGPVKTSPYGTTRFQVEFGQLSRAMFPTFKVYFADHYKVVNDWYIQLIVVPSWNGVLEEQCVDQGMIELDMENNPFFYLDPTSGMYYVSNSPKLWMELFIGCDTIPTSDLGQVVDSLLHEKVRKTRNRMTEQEERERHARVIENVAKDLMQIAQGLRLGLGSVDRELVDLTYGLSMSRTQLGNSQSIMLPPPPMPSSQHHHHHHLHHLQQQQQQQNEPVLLLSAAMSAASLAPSPMSSSPPSSSRSSSEAGSPRPSMVSLASASASSSSTASYH